MRYLVSLFLFMSGYTLPAQNVGLGAREIMYLKKCLASPTGDSGALKVYGAQRLLADQALREDPHPIDTIRSEGLLQGDPKKTATQQALKDMGRIYSLALVCKVSGNRACLRQCELYLRAWAEKDKPRGDPIDDTNLDPLIEAYDMVKSDLSPKVAEEISQWLKMTATTELTAVYNRPGRGTATNNWHSHRLKIIGEIGFAIGDTALEGYAIRGLEAQIAGNLRPDGSSEDFVTRDALHYQVYDLEPLLKLAIVLKRATGADYYSWTSPTGSSIRHSVEWLLPFVTGEKTHAEFVNSTVEFDRRRAQNGEAAYKAGSMFDPMTGVMVLELAAYFDPELMVTARKVAGTELRFPMIIYLINSTVPL